MNKIILIAAMMAFSGVAASNDNAIRALPSILSLILEGSAVDIEPSCELPTIPVQPGFTVNGQCGGFGLKAASLNTRAAGSLNRGNIDRKSVV